MTNQPEGVDLSADLNWVTGYNISHPTQVISSTNNILKFMPPGHFCPDVCGIEDFGEADYWRGRIVRCFFRLMRWWPKPRGRHAHP